MKGYQSPGVFLIVHGCVDMVYSRDNFVVDTFGAGDHVGDYCILDKINQFEFRSNGLTTCLLVPEREIFSILLESQSQMKKTMTRALSRYKESVRIRKEVRKTIQLYSANAEQLTLEELFFKVQKHMNVVFPTLKPNEKYDNPAFLAFEEQFEKVFQLGGQQIMTTTEDQLLQEEDVQIKEYFSKNVKNPFLRKTKLGGTETTSSPNAKKSDRYKESERDPIKSESNTSRFQTALLFEPRTKGKGPKLKKKNHPFLKR